MERLMVWADKAGRNVRREDEQHHQVEPERVKQWLPEFIQTATGMEEPPIRGAGGALSLSNTVLNANDASGAQVVGQCQRNTDHQ